MGLIADGEEPSEAELAQLIFVSGLSTAEAVTELAGRGVGMDVVKSEIAAIGGRVDIASSARPGHHLHHLPAAHPGGDPGGAGARRRSHARDLLGDGRAGAARQGRRADQPVRRRRASSSRSAAIRCTTLRHLLGAAGATEIQPYNSVLLLRSGIQRIALHVDELLGNQEIVVKTIGPQLARVPGVVGATVLADGAHRADRQPGAARGARARRASSTVAARRPRRPQHRRHAARCRPSWWSTTRSPCASSPAACSSARATAWPPPRTASTRSSRSRTRCPSVMLVDIEMPRMDGFDLTRNLRADPRTQQLPIIVISSRTAEKHRTQAAQLGVNAFLGKPYPGGRAAAAHRAIRARMNHPGFRPRSQETDRQVPGDPGDRQRRHQPRVPGARPVRRPRRGDQGARLRAGRRPARPSA